jgi:hypothetical protein
MVAGTSGMGFFQRSLRDRTEISAAPPFYLISLCAQLYNGCTCVQGTATFHRGMLYTAKIVEKADSKGFWRVFCCMTSRDAARIASSKWFAES